MRKEKEGADEVSTRTLGIIIGVMIIIGLIVLGVLLK